MSKRELTAAAIAAAKTWAKAFSDINALDEGEENAEIEEAMADANDNLFDAVEALEAFAPESKEHAGFDYYDVELGGNKVRRARCKFCTAEVNPRGATRHFMSPACKKAHGDLTGADEDAVEKAAKKFCKDLGIELPATKTDS